MALNTPVTLPAGPPWDQQVGLHTVFTIRYNSGMKTTLTVRKIGNSFGVILGKDALAELGIAEGDTLFVVRTPDGIRLTAYDPDFADALAASRDYMRRHRNALRELAR